jgi:pilus assembly protein Flp/PilA
MRNALRVLSEFEKDENGAALLEYTVLLGVLLVAVIMLIGFVGQWVSGQWSALSQKL